MLDRQAVRMQLLQALQERGMDRAYAEEIEWTLTADDRVLSALVSLGPNGIRALLRPDARRAMAATEGHVVSLSMDVAPATVAA